MSVQIHLWRFAFHTGVQRCNTNALQHWSGHISFPTVLCCSAKQAHNKHCVIAIAPWEICSSYLCVVMQHQSPAALVRAHKLPHCSVLLCKTGSQQALCHCNCTLGDLLFIHVCSDATPKPCSTGQGKIASPLFIAALQNRLTAGIVSLQLHLGRFALHTCVQ